MGAEEMRTIADLIARALRGEDVRNEASELRAGFQRVHYCFSA